MRRRFFGLFFFFQEDGHISYTAIWDSASHMKFEIGLKSSILSVVSFVSVVIPGWFTLVLITLKLKLEYVHFECYFSPFFFF
jgi:hypothetical protein